MKDFYYVDAVSYGKSSVFKIKNNKTGAFQAIENMTNEQNIDVQYEENTKITLYKRSKGDKQTHVIDCRKGYLGKIDIGDFKRSLLKQIFSAMIVLYENGYHKPYAPSSLESFSKIIYPVVFKKQH